VAEITAAGGAAVGSIRTRNGRDTFIRSAACWVVSSACARTKDTPWPAAMLARMATRRSTAPRGTVTRHRRLPQPSTVNLNRQPRVWGVRQPPRRRSRPRPIRPSTRTARPSVAGCAGLFTGWVHLTPSRARCLNRGVLTRVSWVLSVIVKVEPRVPRRSTWEAREAATTWSGAASAPSITCGKTLSSLMCRPRFDLEDS
jgi:hypothetical protein